MVGGVVMFFDKNIVENAINSKGHTTLIAAEKVSGLVRHSGQRPFHRLRADKRGVLGTSDWHGRDPAKA